MDDYSKLLKEILKSAKWTQSQLAARLGVSFATINSWINGKSQPRSTMAKKIQSLYTARDITHDSMPVYITITSVSPDLQMDSIVVLEKAPEYSDDDEAIIAKIEDSADSPPMLVANSPDLCIRGTWSAGRIYDKVTGIARAQVQFLSKDFAIARIICWDLENT